MVGFDGSATSADQSERVLTLRTSSQRNPLLFVAAGEGNLRFYRPICTLLQETLYNLLLFVSSYFVTAALVFSTIHLTSLIHHRPPCALFPSLVYSFILLPPFLSFSDVSISLSLPKSILNLWSSVTGRQGIECNIEQGPFLHRLQAQVDPVEGADPPPPCKLDHRQLPR